jgi:hypothetical protein
MKITHFPWLVPAIGLVAVVSAVVAQQTGPVSVTVRDESPVAVESLVPVDPVKRINYDAQGLGVSLRSEQNQTLHLSHYPTFHVNGQLFQFGNGSRVEYVNKPLPQDKSGKAREGFTSRYVHGDLRVTATFTVVPTKAADRAAKRRRDAMIIHYVVDNVGKQPQKVGLRIFMDTYVVNNDQCLFAAPTMPGKILNGVVLKGQEFPPYLQLLQRPDLKNPGFVAHLTFDLGSRLEKPERIVLTRLGAGGGGWDVPAMPAGDSALAFFWEPKEIKPGSKREFAYGYGQGITTSPENEGLVQVNVGGSFVPGKRFSIAAHVTDPALGQFLTLELPQGMVLLEGKEIQPVPALQGESAYSVVMWHARVQRPGEFPVRIRSSTGVTQGKVITVTPAGK